MCMARNSKHVNKSCANKNIKAAFLVIVSHWVRETGSGASSGTCPNPRMLPCGTTKDPYTVVWKAPSTSCSQEVWVLKHLLGLCFKHVHMHFTSVVSSNKPLFVFSVPTTVFCCSALFFFFPEVKLACTFVVYEKEDWVWLRTFFKQQSLDHLTMFLLAEKIPSETSSNHPTV